MGHSSTWRPVELTSTQANLQSSRLGKLPWQVLVKLTDQMIAERSSLVEAIIEVDGQ